MVPDLLVFLVRAVIVCGVVVGGVACLTLFFNWLPRLTANRVTIQNTSLAAVLPPERSFDVVLTSGQKIAGVQFEGLCSADRDGSLSHFLNSLASFRTSDGRRVLLRLDQVRVLEESATRAAESAT